MRPSISRSSPSRRTGNGLPTARLVPGGLGNLRLEAERPGGPPGPGAAVQAGRCPRRWSSLAVITPANGARRTARSAMVLASACLRLGDAPLRQRRLVLRHGDHPLLPQRGWPDRDRASPAPRPRGSARGVRRPRGPRAAPGPRRPVPSFRGRRGPRLTVPLISGAMVALRVAADGARPPPSPRVDWTAPPSRRGPVVEVSPVRAGARRPPRRPRGGPPARGPRGGGGERHRIWKPWTPHRAPGVPRRRGEGSECFRQDGRGAGSRVLVTSREVVTNGPGLDSGAAAVASIAG